MYRRIAVGSGCGTYRRHTNNGNDNDGGVDSERLRTLSRSMSPLPFAEDINGAGGLQGLSPGSGQGTYAAQFRSPCPHSHQSRGGVECSTGSIFDATSPRCSGMGVGGSILSSGVDSVKTASSLWLREERDTAGVWKNDENKGRENVNWGGGGHEEMEDERESKANSWGEGQEEESDRRRQLDVVGEEGGRVASAAPEDHARCSSSRQERGPATR